MKRLLLVGSMILATGGACLAGTMLASADSVAAEELVPAFGQPQQPADRLPTSIPLEDWGKGGLNGDSSRLLGSEGTRNYWAALDASGQICVIVSLGDSGQTVGGACNYGSVVASGGLELGLQGVDGRTFVTYLLPAGTETGSLREDWTVVSGNIVVVQASDSAVRSTVYLPNGDPVSISG